MLLIYNVILDEEKKIKYDRIFSEIYRRLNFPFDIRYIDYDLKESDISQYSHLLISGSEIFASEDNRYNRKVSEVIGYFMKNKKAIIGICYGHQMIAKTISGNKVCRRRKAPEFGWKSVKINFNHLFEGIQEPIFYESHYDEVFDLDENYKIIATNKVCSVQAFQYKDLPIWGTQFHPEVDYKTGETSLKQRFEKFPEEKTHYVNEITESDNELYGVKNFDQRLKIFENFVTPSSRWDKI